MTINDLLPIPDLENAKKLLCVEPHPDDNEVGAGATIAKLAKNGCNIIYLTVTDGRIGTVNPNDKPVVITNIRKEEIKKSAGILGVDTLLELNYGDSQYIPERELTKKIVGIIRKIEPDFVMTVDPFLPYEVHPDHRMVGMAAAEACLFSPFPHFYSFNEAKPSKIWNVKGIAFYNTAYPNTFINVDDTWDLKLQAIEAHKSQFSGDTLLLYEKYFDLKSQELANGKGFTHAEAFKVMTPMHLHCNVDAINC